MQFRDLKAQYQALKEDIDRAMSQVLTDSNYISGRQVAELEQSLAEYVGVKHCITCANGTDALTLALMTWGIG
ncbi:MAG: DegT/DnrJ/EryC1/StrS family aminotransferase, partial [Blautia sp.]|nr:DegT/DnrJ/EryC1/StrS family aminotransferase [Blautia sp.]